MRSKGVIFDVDGVLADFVGGFTARARELFPDVPITQTHGQASWNGFAGMDKKQIGMTWESIKGDRYFWRKLAPLVDAVALDRIYYLHRDNNVYFVTSRVGVDCKRQTEYWLEAQGIARPTVVICKRKGEFAKAVDADCAIDDKANNASCIDWITEGTCKSYLLDRPYNQAPQDFMGSGVVRVSSVEQYLDIIGG